MRVVYRSPPFLLEGYRAFKIRYEDMSYATVLEHREVVASMLGRGLLPKEVVHHINGNKLDNSPGNLEVITQSVHARLHGKSRKVRTVVITCLECGASAVKRASYVKHNQVNNKRAGPFCGRSCAGRFNARRRANG